MTRLLVRDALPEVYADLTSILAVDVVDSAIRDVEIISGQTEDGMHVAAALRRLSSEGT